MVREAIAIAKPVLQIIAALSGAGKDQPAAGPARKAERSVAGRR